MAQIMGKLQVEDIEPPSGMTMFTFADLAAEIEASMKTAKAKGKGSWRRLLEVVNTVQKSDSAAGTFDAVTDRHWMLTRLAVRGFGGVVNEESLELALDPTPGITVLHGSNGSGKSSITDAMEAVLTGEIKPLSGASIWDPVPISRGHSDALVEVTLQSEEELLHLRLEVGDGQSDVVWRCELESAGSRVPVEFSQLWHDAWTSHRPVFAYASIERRIQRTADLATYFQDLLALGGAFVALEDEVARLGREANEARRAFNLAWGAARSVLEGVDAAYPEFGGQGEIAEPDLKKMDTPEAWLSLLQTSEPGEVHDEISESDLDRLHSAAAEVLGALGSLGAAQSAIPQELIPGLQSLHRSAAQVPNTLDDCPVCGQPSTDWHSRLDSALLAVNEVAELHRLASRTISALGTLSDQVLKVALRAMGESDSEVDRVRADHGTELLSGLSEALLSSAPAKTVMVHDAARALAGWLDDPKSTDLLKRAAARTNREARWRTQRANAVVPFIDCWRRVGDQARQANDWADTGKRIGTLRADLMKKRTKTLTKRADETMGKLLSDVGLTLASVHVTARTATPQILDRSGEEVGLGMLSAGQRNAMLLAPLISSIEAGPFGFTVLDDPVHAFDQMRVDALAKVLARVAEDRRVIVLTHDERLREQLIAHAASSQSMNVVRSPEDGTVQVEAGVHFWKQLLDDAEAALKLGAVEQVSLSVTDIVRGLCRQAVDNALRAFVFHNAAVHHRDAMADVRRLDRAYTTSRRLDVAKRLFGGDDPNPVAEAKTACNTYMDDWNQASHGNVATSDVTVDEVHAAREACTLLTAWAPS